jgi:ribosome-binding protein aMBF1 (putative translation factor)
MTVLEIARRELGLSQKELGDHPKVRIHQTFISLCERGMGLPTADQRVRLAAVLGVDPAKLLDPVDVTESARV